MVWRFGFERNISPVHKAFLKLYLDGGNNSWCSPRNISYDRYLLDAGGMACGIGNYNLYIDMKNSKFMVIKSNSFLDSGHAVDKCSSFFNTFVLLNVKLRD